ncbi:hypothetical protein EDB86DRAFT_2833424 [Lactarius hatsudake]|nr:hypothetical protein EDB86DRAFT_2833424 [Lactarius hatsudake]
MSLQSSCKFTFAKQGFLGLCPWLEGDVGGAKAAEELAQTFSVSLEMVHSAAVDADLDVATDSEVNALLSLTCNCLLPHALASWLEHSPHLVAGGEAEFCPAAVAPLAPLDVSGGYTWLAEYWQQVEAGTMSHLEFKAHHSAILMANPRLGLPSSLAVSSPLLQLSMEPLSVGRSVSPAEALLELFSNQTLHSSALHMATAASLPSKLSALPSYATAATAPPRSVKCGRKPALMDMNDILGYAWHKVKSRMPPPYRPHARGRADATDPSVMGPSTTGPSIAVLSGAATTSNLHLPVSVFSGPELPTTGVTLAATIMFWRGEVAHALATWWALDQYAHFLGALVELELSSSKLPHKWAQTGASCGPSRGPTKKGKESADDDKAMDDAEDSAGASDHNEGAGAGGNSTDDGNGAGGNSKASWMGFSANFGPKKFLAVPSYHAGTYCSRRFSDGANQCAYWWFGLRSRPEDVTAFLHDFYQVWDHAKHMAVQLRLPGLTESAHELRNTIEEAAAPHAKLEWLLLFPGVFEDHCSWIIHYAAMFSRAQALVIANVISAQNIPSLWDPYILAIAKFRNMHTNGVIGLDEFQWQEEHLGCASFLDDIRRRESLGEATLTSLG